MKGIGILLLAAGAWVVWRQMTGASVTGQDQLAGGGPPPARNNPLGGLGTTVVIQDTTGAGLSSLASAASAKKTG
jgi:hypothetical protein